FGVDAILGRRRDARVVDRIRAGRRDALERLTADLQALAHLGDPDQVPRVGVAFGPYRHGEVVGLVAEVRKHLPHVVIDAGRARNWPEQAVPDRIVARDPSDVPRPLDVDL